MGGSWQQHVHCTFCRPTRLSLVVLGIHQCLRGKTSSLVVRMIVLEPWAGLAVKSHEKEAWLMAVRSLCVYSEVGLQSGRSVCGEGRTHGY